MSPVFLLLAACTTSPNSVSQGGIGFGVDPDVEQPDSASPLTTDEVLPTPPTLQALATEEAGQRWPGVANRGNLVIDETTLAYLFGELADVERVLEGENPIDALRVVLVDPSGLCLGVLERLPTGAFLGADLTFDGDSFWVGDQATPVDPCQDEAPDLVGMEVKGANLRVEALEDWRTEENTPPPSCSSSCGSTESTAKTYAGQTAYSNGSYTGTGSSCTTTDTYGSRYQCVQYTERVHRRSDWAGNAYPGYWTQTGLSSSSSSQGPYYKGLLPLGSGTGYLAPQAGDVVVWSGGDYGHVAILASVGSSSLTVYDQNRRCGDQSCTMTYSSSGYTIGNGSGTGYCGSEGISSYTPRGYLHRGWDFGGTYGLASSSSSGASTHNWWLNDASYSGSTTSSSVTDITDYITINPGATDPYMTSPAGLAIPAYSSSTTYGYRYVSFYIRTNCTSHSAQLFWKRTTDSGFSSSRAVSATIASGTGWSTLTFNPSSSSYWSGTIDQIRLDPAASCSTSSTDTISIQSAWFWR